MQSTLPVAPASAARRSLSAGRELLTLAGSGAFLPGATAASDYPTMIRSVNTPSLWLTALNASASHESHWAGLICWPAGFVLAIVYFVSFSPDCTAARPGRQTAEATEGMAVDVDEKGARVSPFTR
jgi:hypothetical protein